MPTDRVPTLSEVIDNAITSRLADTYHILPGVVVAYYPSTQDADVHIAVNDPRFDPDSDTLETEPWPVCPHVRVAWPRISNVNLTGTLNPGDPVQCFFQDLDDSAFRANGQANDPNRTLRHGSDSMFCVPWNITDKGVTSNYDSLPLCSFLDNLIKALLTLNASAPITGTALQAALSGQGITPGFTTAASPVNLAK